MAFLIGDTIRLGATVKNLDGEEQAPNAITVTIYREDATTKILNLQAATKKTGTIAEYYHDWTVTGPTVAETLIALWEWTGPHKKRISFEVEPAI